MTALRQGPPVPESVVDFVVTGTAGGADATSTPAEVTALLGDGFVESRTGRQLLRCYDLVEFAWERDAGGGGEADGGPWRGLYVTVQAHRFDAPPTLDALAAALDRAGFPLVEVAPDGVGCRRLVRADSRVGVLVDGTTGEVVKLSAPAWFAPGPRGEPSPLPPRTVRDLLRHLTGLGAPEREEWARRRLPQEADEAARWWWSLWVAGRQRLGPGSGQEGGPALSAARETALWLLGKCEDAGVLDRTESACEIARYGLLGPDAAVRACLDAIPVSRAEVATRRTTPYARDHLAAVNASRSAKRLSLAAGALLPRARDPELCAEVRAWLELRPLLM
ncbi:hypothetical protein [Streptomyces sp. DH8]|uniref:hypothetical protein n=1 Tax=Streptomyces sp. DH8 TaxID=2857008 RepID=UPI001E3B7D48|nr:hypothetical protein [Streptomyces sp. DH8]